MSFVRSKYINGCGPYYYEVRSVWENGTCRQEHIRYIGTSPETAQSAPSKTLVPKSEEPRKGYLDVGEGEASERKIPKTWDRQRYSRAKVIAESTGSTYFQADALAKTAWRIGLDPGKVDWDQLQGKDLSYDEKVEKLGEMTGMSTKTEKEQELEHELWEESQTERERFRTSEFQGADI